MKKLVNFRLFLLCALFIICVIFSCVYFAKSGMAKLCFICVLSILAVAIIGGCFIYNGKILRSFAFAVIISILPVVMLYSSQVRSQNLAKLEGREVTVVGRIYDVKDVNNRYVRLTLDDVKILDGETEQHIAEKLFIRISSYNLDSSEAKLGRIVVAETQLSIYSVNELNFYTGGYLANNIYGIGYCYNYNVEFTDKYDETLRDKVKTGFKEHLDQMNFNYSQLGYSMFFGDTSDLDEVVVDSFRGSGVAHILAVSGLHVSIILFILNFILKKCRANNVVRLIFSIILLLFYNYLCGFSVSVMRASLMSTLLLYSKCRGKCYDKLNALSFVACLFLMFDPLYLFSISFILSFTTVFAIIILCNSIYRGLLKYFNKFVASTLSLNLSVQIIIFANSMLFFHDYQILSLFANLVTVPIVSIAFIYFILFSLLTLIFPFLSFLAYPYSWLMGFVVNFNYSISALNFNIGFGNVSGWAVILTMLLMFVCSHYLFATKKYKIPISLVIIAVLALLPLL